MSVSTAIAWKQADGTPVACRETLAVLAENHAELAQTMQDAFDDALLMGVEEEFFREVLRDLVAGLKSPLR